MTHKSQYSLITTLQAYLQLSPQGHASRKSHCKSLHPYLLFIVFIPSTPCPWALFVHGTPCEWGLGTCWGPRTPRLASSQVEAAKNVNDFPSSQFGIRLGVKSQQEQKRRPSEPPHLKTGQPILKLMSTKKKQKNPPKNSNLSISGHLLSSAILLGSIGDNLPLSGSQGGEWS